MYGLHISTYIYIYHHALPHLDHMSWLDDVITSILLSLLVAGGGKCQDRGFWRRLISLWPLKEAGHVPCDGGGAGGSVQQRRPRTSRGAISNRSTALTLLEKLHNYYDVIMISLSMSLVYMVFL